MATELSKLGPQTLVTTPAQTALGALFGVAFTFCLFFLLAHLERKSSEESAPSFVDLQTISLPPPPPPPSAARSDPMTEPQDVVPLTGIEIESSAGGVKIAVAPPEVAFAMPPARPIPPAAISLGSLSTVVKPGSAPAFDEGHIFQQNEVDQVPVALTREAPNVPYAVYRGAPELSVLLLIVLEADGRASSVRIAKSSGNPAFDTIVAETVRTRWAFSAAVRKGKNVRCLLQQSFRIRFSARSPFQL